MTKQNEPDTRFGDRPAFEITPDMVEAGLDAFYEHNAETEGARVLVLAVYTAMNALSLNRTARQSPVPLSQTD